MASMKTGMAPWIPMKWTAKRSFAMAATGNLDLTAKRAQQVRRGRRVRMERMDKPAPRAKPVPGVKMVTMDKPVPRGTQVLRVKPALKVPKVPQGIQAPMLNPVWRAKMTTEALPCAAPEATRSPSPTGKTVMMPGPVR